MRITKPSQIGLRDKVLVTSSEAKFAVDVKSYDNGLPFGFMNEKPFGSFDIIFLEEFTVTLLSPEKDPEYFLWC